MIAKTDSEREGKPFIIRHNVRSRSLKGFIREFEENESYRLVHRKDSVKIFHTIISFSNKDSHLVTDRMLKDIAAKYISERGLNNLYVGAKHSDRDHVHIHLAVSGVQLNGRSSRITKQQFHHIKLELDRYQKLKYPQLIHSLPQHGRKKREADREEVLNTIKRNREAKKELLCESLKNIYDKSKSKEQFLEELKVLGYEPYYRNHKLQGVLCDGTKFRLGRLGYDEATLESLDQQHREELTVQELTDLRGAPQQDIDNRMKVAEEASEVREVQEVPIHEENMLEELASLRMRSEERERPNERTIQDDSSGAGSAFDQLRRVGRGLDLGLGESE